MHPALWALTLSFADDPPAMTVAERLERARVEIHARDFASALVLADEALLADPASLDAHYLRGFTLDQLGRHAEAVAELRPVFDAWSAAGPQSSADDARFRLALALGADGHPAEALALADPWPGDIPDPLDRSRVAIATYCWRLALTNREEDVSALHRELDLLPAGELTWYAAWGRIALAREADEVSREIPLVLPRAWLNKHLALRLGALHTMDRLVAEAAQLQESAWSLDGLASVAQARVALGDAIAAAPAPRGAGKPWRTRMTELSRRQWAIAAEAADLGQTHAARLGASAAVSAALDRARAAAEQRLAD